MSVVFDFNASLNDVAPVSSMPLPTDATQQKKNEKKPFVSRQYSIVGLQD